MTRDELLQAYSRGRRSFQWVDLEGADLGRANLVGADLGGANLRGANLVGAYLEGVNLGRANLAGANLVRAVLDRANLGRAKLGQSNLEGAYLEGANLGRANLAGANLVGAKLEGTNIGGSDLGGGVRLHESGVWTLPPPRCEAGDWWAICLAPGIVRIGCTTLPLHEWLGAQGEYLAEENDVSPMDQHVLRCWAEMLADLGGDLPGWVPDARGDA